MKRAILASALIGLAISRLAAGGKGTVTGAYVEARTAEVFTGGCIMNSEAQTMGKEAVLAWRVDRGSFNGVALDGLSVVAALSGDHNLGMTEMGGDKPIVPDAPGESPRPVAGQAAAGASNAAASGGGASCFWDGGPPRPPTTQAKPSRPAPW